jgi:bifunctional DNase/RNase
MPDDLSNDDDGLEIPPSFFPKSDESEGPRSYGEPVLCQIEGVYAVKQDTNISQFVRLTDGDRLLHISIGPFEAISIGQALERNLPDRPLTHDLIKTLIERLNAHVRQVVIDDLWNNVYYAKIHLSIGKEIIEVDSRPSDAIAIAVRFNAPIFVADGILELGEDL